MTIGIDASRYGHPQSTGVEWYSYHIIRHLIPELRSLNPSAEIVLYNDRVLAIGEELAVAQQTFSAKKFWTLWALSKQILKSPPDVLFVPSHTLPLSLPKKTIITIHDVAFRKLPDCYTIREKLYLNWSTKFAVKKADILIVPSESTKEDLIEEFDAKPEKITVIPHGFDPGSIVQTQGSIHELPTEFGDLKPDKFFLFIGRLEKKKNLVNLLEAFSRFTNIRPDFKLVLAGKRGYGFREIWQTIEKHHLQSKVVMPGYVNEEEKAILLQSCNAFVFPSLYEGFGLPLLEAFAYKKPIITSKISAIPEVAGQSALLINPGSVDELLQAMDDIVKNIELRETLINSGYERLSKFSWHEAAKKTAEIILAP